MCNINLIYNKRNRDDFNVTNCMNVMSYNSWKSNDHGEGFIAQIESDSGVVTGKSPTKIIFRESCKLLVTHQRLSSSGFNDANIHPHETKDLILMHNGVFRGMGNEKDSDTKEYVEKLQQLYPIMGLIKAIKYLHKTILGSWSIIVYEKQTGKIFYYKNMLTSMFIVRNNNYLVLSTKYENTEYAKKYLNISKDISEVKPYVIYDILDDFRAIDEIESIDKVAVEVEDESDNETQTKLCFNCGHIYDSNDGECSSCGVREDENPEWEETK